ncbi:hypothetical protein [Halobaculum sp. P14]|uniref:hypothetical protein n=1 Tax=Halobaculum sp. P14 TaxID=3421638 RepID=UPI003EBAEDB7
MKFKLVPEPPETAAFVRDVQAAVPLVPGSEDDCCARLMRRCGFESRDVARTWLTFLRAVDLAEETDSGFRRRRVDSDADHLRAALLAGVYGADELAAALLAADDPLTAADAFDRFADRVPEWERHRRDDWVAVWRDRVARLLGWFALLDLADRTDDGYVATDTLRSVHGQ